MRSRRRLTGVWTLALVVAMAASAAAAGRVELQLVGDARGSLLAFQEWVRVLGRAGIENVRIRNGRATGKIGIEVRGTQREPFYVVTGRVKSRDELLLPSGRFRRSDVGRLKRWLDDLAKLGPEDRREPRSAFGLTRAQFEQVQQDMARPLGFSTKGGRRSEVVAKIARRLLLPLQMDPALARALEGDTVNEELSGISCGTTLAYVLRPMGLYVIPREVDGRLAYAVTKAKPGLEIWPVGRKPEKPNRDVLPAMFTIHNVNVQGVSASRAMEAIGGLLKTPVLVDHNALARHGIEPDEVTVSHPQKQTTYGTALQKILFQARLKSEVRVDEAGKPFLWITTLKPV